MIEGDLKYFEHIHHFEKKDSGTLMTDRIDLEAPFGFLGKIVMAFFLKNYFQKFLTERNAMIKQYAENGKV